MNYDQWKTRELDDLYDDPPEEHRRNNAIDDPDWENWDALSQAQPDNE